jgi:hypothetical protein
LLDKGRRFLMYHATLRGLDRAGFVHRLADDVHDAPERFIAHRHGDRLARVGDRCTANEPLRRIHGDGAHGILAQVLGDFEHQPITAVVGLERVQDSR